MAVSEMGEWLVCEVNERRVQVSAVGQCLVCEVKKWRLRVSVVVRGFVEVGRVSVNYGHLYPIG